jgi:hypothetical protein
MKQASGCPALGLAAFQIGVFPLAAAANEPLRERLISADLQQVQGPLNTMFRQCVGAGRANEGLRADWQRHLAYARRAIHVVLGVHRHL